MLFNSAATLSPRLPELSPWYLKHLCGFQANFPNNADKTPEGYCCHFYLARAQLARSGMAGSGDCKDENSSNRGLSVLKKPACSSPHKKDELLAKAYLSRESDWQGNTSMTVNLVQVLVQAAEAQRIEKGKNGREWNQQGEAADRHPDKLWIRCL
ncbi:hypothetical protein STEG23_015880 [Scotinomys teguina]